MIKFTGLTPEGARLIGLGLSRANCELLLQHKPIRIDLVADLNIPVHPCRSLRSRRFCRMAAPQTGRSWIGMFSFLLVLFALF